MYGCRRCDYDLCEECNQQRLKDQKNPARRIERLEAAATRRRRRVRELELRLERLVNPAPTSAKSLFQRATTLIQVDLKRADGRSNTDMEAARAALVRALEMIDAEDVPLPRTLWRSWSVFFAVSKLLRGCRDFRRRAARWHRSGQRRWLVWKRWISTSPRRRRTLRGRARRAAGKAARRPRRRVSQHTWRSSRTPQPQRPR